MALPTWNCVGKKGTLCLPPTTGCFPPGAEQVTASALALGTWHIMFSANEHQNTDTHVGKLGKKQGEKVYYNLISSKEIVLGASEKELLKCLQNTNYVSLYLLHYRRKQYALL